MAKSFLNKFLFYWPKLRRQRLRRSATTSTKTSLVHTPVVNKLPARFGAVLIAKASFWCPETSMIYLMPL